MLKIRYERFIEKCHILFSVWYTFLKGFAYSNSWEIIPSAVAELVL